MGTELVILGASISLIFLVLMIFHINKDSKPHFEPLHYRDTKTIHVNGHKKVIGTCIGYDGKYPKFKFRWKNNDVVLTSFYLPKTQIPVGANCKLYVEFPSMNVDIADLKYTTFTHWLQVARGMNLAKLIYTSLIIIGIFTILAGVL